MQFDSKSRFLMNPLFMCVIFVADPGRARRIAALRVFNFFVSEHIFSWGASDQSSDQCSGKVTVNMTYTGFTALVALAAIGNDLSVYQSIFIYIYSTGLRFNTTQLMLIDGAVDYGNRLLDKNQFSHDRTVRLYLSRRSEEPAASSKSCLFAK